MSTTPKIKINLDLVEASVVFTDEFNELDSLVRADLLKDMLRDIQTAYDIAVIDLREHSENLRAESMTS
jgi:hypothetical protein